METPLLYLGVDVGTGSARAGLFDATGRMWASASHPIQIWRPRADFVEQSSEDIWQACVQAVRGALQEAGVPAAAVRGVGFDATCSLVVLDAEGRPLTVSPTGRNEQNVIVWMDHRATAEAESINRTGHEVLRYVGGTISPEMQAPKLRWLKTHLPETWSRAGYFLDLPDYLTFRATGDPTRSLCTTVCKWTYLGHEAEGWSEGFWRAIGLEDLVERGYEPIGGRRIRPMGEAVGDGLTGAAADDLGLEPATPVGVAIIDAHAGGLGALGTPVDGEALEERAVEERLALIGGTSSCHMAASPEARFVEGIWGPYFSAMVPGLWLTEGGQSATGALIDHIIYSHARSREVQAEADDTGRTVYEVLNHRLDRLSEGVSFPALLTRELHVLPYFHGNRSPRADPSLRGMISGLRLENTVEELALLYLAAVQAVAHGTRHIIDEMNRSGYRIRTIIACGGGTKNPVFLREHADISGCRVVLPREPEAVLLGSAMLGAAAAGAYDTVLEAMQAMSAPGKVIEPAEGTVAAYHEAKHRVFLRLYEDQCAYRALMAEGIPQPEVQADAGGG